MIAALYVDRAGVYFGRPDVDPWDVARDARAYAGPWPVVAHPPCGPWGNLRHLYVPNRDRVNEADCGPRAVEQVRALGGALEHPCGSKLWEHCGLPRPGDNGDAHGGYTVVVEQVNWGHVARKRTWLYVVGVALVVVTAGIRWGAEPTHWISGGRNPMRKNGARGGGIVPPGIKVCSSAQRRRTPPAFADWLIALAACAGANRARGAA